MFIKFLVILILSWLWEPVLKPTFSCIKCVLLITSYSCLYSTFWLRWHPSSHPSHPLPAPYKSFAHIQRVGLCDPEFNQGCWCVYRFAAIHRLMLSSSVGTQLKTVPALPQNASVAHSWAGKVGSHGPLGDLGLTPNKPSLAQAHGWQLLLIGDDDWNDWAIPTWLPWSALPALRFFLFLRVGPAALKGVIRMSNWEFSPSL